MSTPAARITGVASRNEKRRASSRRSPARMPAAVVDAGPRDARAEGQDLDAADRQRLRERHPRQPGVRGDAVGDLVARDLGRDRLRAPGDRAAHHSMPSRIRPLTIRKHAAGTGPPEVGAQPVLEEQADQADRDRAHDELPDQPLVGGARCGGGGGW